MSDLLRVTGLHVNFETPRGVVRANRGINLTLGKKESLGIMGESGCGKTVLILSLMRLQQPGVIAKGSIIFNGRDIAQLKEKEMQAIRGKGIALIPQNHSTALNPAYTVGQQLAESFVRKQGKNSLWHMLKVKPGKEGQQSYERIRYIFNQIGFDNKALLERLMGSYPHELSGGMRQRALIGMSLLLEPELLISDEPTTALDRATRKETLSLLGGLTGSATTIVVSHEVETIASLCNRVAVMYGGKIVETGPTGEVFSNPRHPYTQMLLNSQQYKRGEKISITMLALDMVSFPSGCAFCPSCSRAMPVCWEKEPAESQIGGVTVVCHLYGGGDKNC